MSSSALWGHNKKLAVCDLVGEGSLEPNHASTLILNFCSKVNSIELSAQQVFTYFSPFSQADAAQSKMESFPLLHEFENCTMGWNHYAFFFKTTF